MQILKYPPLFFPRTVTFQNFVNVQKEVPIWTYAKNTFVYTSIVTCVSVFVNAMAGYAFARTNFKGKRILFACLLATMMIPFHVMMIPLFMMIYSLGMLYTLPGLVIPKFAGIAGIFFMRSFFVSLPKQLEEAARIDGLREFSIFTRIMLPLCKPAIITQIVLTINACWNDLLWPLLFTNRREQLMLANGISLYVGVEAQYYGVAFAAGVISVLPLLIVFIFGQKYFVNSIVSTGIKG